MNNHGGSRNNSGRKKTGINPLYQRRMPKHLFAKMDEFLTKLKQENHESNS